MNEQDLQGLLKHPVTRRAALLLAMAGVTASACRTPEMHPPQVSKSGGVENAPISINVPAPNNPLAELAVVRVVAIGNYKDGTQKTVAKSAVRIARGTYVSTAEGFTTKERGPLVSYEAANVAGLKKSTDKMGELGRIASIATIYGEAVDLSVFTTKDTETTSLPLDKTDQPSIGQSLSLRSYQPSEPRFLNNPITDLSRLQAVTSGIALRYGPLPDRQDMFDMLTGFKPEPASSIQPGAEGGAVVTEYGLLGIIQGVAPKITSVGQVRDAYGLTLTNNGTELNDVVAAQVTYVQMIRQDLVDELRDNLMPVVYS